MALCPGETDDCTDENIKKAADRGVKLMLLEGDESGEVLFHKELMKSAQRSGLNAVYHINKGAGHDIPEDWDEKLGKAIDFFMK